MRRRLWAQDLQFVADVVGIPISSRSEQESRLVSFLGGVVAWGARAAGRLFGFLMKAGPYVWLDPEGGICTLDVFS